MTLSVQVDCITKNDRLNPHERILTIGGPNPDGTRWWLTQQQAIADIKAGRWAFYVKSLDGSIVWIEVARSEAGNDYLKTENDGHLGNNLLYLLEC